jgi:hypothetical protein
VGEIIGRILSLIARGQLATVPATVLPAQVKDALRASEAEGQTKKVILRFSS